MHHISGPRALTEIRFLLIDLDGVLYRGDASLPAAPAFIPWLRQRGIRFRLVTNNATLTPDQYVRKLSAMGIRVHADEVFTSALATGLYLRNQKASGQRAFVIGEDGLLEALRAASVQIDGGQPDWVVVGLDRNVTYEKLAGAALAIERGARFVGTNPDTSLPTEQGLLPGAGALLAALAATTGREPVIVGKPKPLMLCLAAQALDAPAAETAMLGDRLDTDIVAAHAARMASILVLTGVSKRADLDSDGDKPSLVVDDLNQLMAEWDKILASPRDGS